MRCTIAETRQQLDPCIKCLLHAGEVDGAAYHTVYSQLDVQVSKNTRCLQHIEFTLDVNKISDCLKQQPAGMVVPDSWQNCCLTLLAFLNVSSAVAALPCTAAHSKGVHMCLQFVVLAAMCTNTLTKSCGQRI